MEDVDAELWALGVNAKTRHNEVAPSQYELAPIFTTTNVAMDHNQLVMDTLKKVASKHGLACLLHEKPFSGVNGSGKHNNWSMSSNDGQNLLEPGSDTHENAQFLVFLVATIKAVDKYSDLLRVAISNPGNDHRLGANEAPPAIISIFLGDQLNDIIEQIEKGEATSSKNGTFMEIGVSTLPDLPKDTTDRNRTSPFAFTGNKFEFRAVPSSLSLGDPNCFLNTMVAEALDDIATELEGEVKKGTDFLKAVQKILTDIIKKHKRIIFNGDNYSEDWRKEAEKRGLYNFKTLVDAMPSLITEKNFKLFEKYKVLSKRELEARYVIQLEGYNKTINQEGQVTLDIGRRQILPAALRYQTDLATSISLVKSVASDADLKPQIDLLKQVTSEISSLKTKLDVLEHELNHEGGDELSHAKHYRDNVIPKMKDVRAVADNLETIVDNEYWPLPTYAEMLYIV
jgi:glutamine synthetase